MMLITGNDDDRLVHELARAARETGLSVEVVNECDLFEACPFALHACRERTRASVTLRGRSVDGDEIDGVVLRWRRTWWPSSAFDLQDQMFVYHETMAAWFAVLNSLSCPIVNRFGLGWFLQDVSYPLELRSHLARALECAVSADGEVETRSGWLLPTARKRGGGTESVYWAAGRLFPAPDCGCDVAARLTASAAAISAWGRETGMVLSRMDFERRDDLELKAVEPVPLLDGEPDVLVRALSTAVLDEILESSGKSS